MDFKVLIVGVGNMGGALAKGLCESKAPVFSVSAFDTHQQRLAELAKSIGVKPVVDLGADPSAYDVVLLAIKPQDLGQVGRQLAGKLAPTQVLISILAGITLEDLAKSCQFSGTIVRAMPNIAGLIHCAATAMCATQQASQDHLKIAHAIFSAIGEADWTKESLMDAVTGLSGSGPAYIYMVIEALTDGGVKMGIPRQLAAKLATQTVLGAARLVKETKQHPAVLREQVTTPGGTTINAIHELEDRGLRAMLMSAVETATLRSAFLRKNQT
jgi:pyrroline-5-carboxylate reductase